MVRKLVKSRPVVTFWPLRARTMGGAGGGTGVGGQPLGAGRDAREAEGAGGGGRGRGQDRAGGGVEEIDRPAREASRAGVLGAVAVEVVEGQAPERQPLEGAEVLAAGHVLAAAAR